MSRSPKTKGPPKARKERMHRGRKWKARNCKPKAAIAPESINSSKAEFPSTLNACHDPASTSTTQRSQYPQLHASPTIAARAANPRDVALRIAPDVISLPLEQLPSLPAKRKPKDSSISHAAPGQQATNPAANNWQHNAVAAPILKNSVSQRSDVDRKSFSSGTTLTPEQRARIERHRSIAMAKKRAKRSEGLRMIGRVPFGANQPAVSNKFMQDDAPPDLISPLPPDAPPLRETTLRKLSKQQIAVVNYARPPPPPINGSSKARSGRIRASFTPHPPRHLVRITAAAGTGKTTTLLHLALRCFDLGHTHLTYVTFTKASAKDAKERIKSLLEESSSTLDLTKLIIEASTLHSCAMKCLRPSEEGKEEKGLLDDYAFRDFIRKTFRKKLDQYLRHAYSHLETIGRNSSHDTFGSTKKSEKRLLDQAIFYLYKTFHNFCISKMTLENLKDEGYYSRHYYPVKTEFKEGGKAAKIGFPSQVYSQPQSYKFYADTCAEIWKYVIDNDIRTFDVDMKRAQLNRSRIPGSVLLVDECQDLDACQVDWVASQLQYGTHVFFVGDAAQTVYSFRGAKSANVTSLTGCIEGYLTQSWRFGPAIAQVANIPLFVKENSPQTTSYSGNKKAWMPYRVEGARSGEESKITKKLLSVNWIENRPLTLIGRSNGSLMMKAIELMGLSHLRIKNDEKEDSEQESIGGAELNDNNPISLCEDSHHSCPAIQLDNCPKIHINGKGESSGLKKWQSVSKQIKSLCKLYASKDKRIYLPEKEFRDFVGNNHVTWESFKADCQRREINTYVPSIRIVEAFGENTSTAMDAFENEVMSKNYSAEEADIILTTCHAAKGLEWDNVEVCGDFLNLGSVSYKCDLPKIYRCPSFLSNKPDCVKPKSSSLEPCFGEIRNGWQFDVCSYGDDLNLLYVACTRAKKVLHIPQSICVLLEEFDSLHFIVTNMKKEASEGRKKFSSSDSSMFVLKKDRLTKGDVWNLYHDLCQPLRNELVLSHDCNMMESLFPDDHHDPGRTSCQTEKIESKALP